MNRAQFVDLVRCVSIRRLSVFVTFLEGVYRPENANYAFCIKASGLISSALDEVLEYLLSLAANDIPQPGPELTSQLAAGTYNAMPNAGLAVVGHVDDIIPDLLDWNADDLIDMQNWMEGIDWSNAGGEV
jgi:hypothetical protein